MVLACRSPMEFSAAIEDISEHNSNMNIVLPMNNMALVSIPIYQARAYMMVLLNISAKLLSKS
jgi:hypothetical protein